MVLSNYKSDVTFQFLLYLIRKHVHRYRHSYVDSFDTENIKKVNFDRLFKLITYHKVELIVLPILKDMDIPGFNYSQLNLRTKKIVKKQLLMEKILSDILAKFDENKVENIILKGLPLDKKLYGNKGKRVYNDIDILIKENQLKTAHKLLLDLGFCFDKDLFSIEFISKNSLVRKGLKDIVYINKKYNITLELHWRPLIIGNFKYDIYSECSENFQYAFRAYRVLKNEYCLSYLVIHGYRSAWHRIKWLIDIISFIQNLDFDKKKFHEIILEEFGEYRSVMDLSKLLKDFFNFTSNILVSNNDKFFDRYACKYRIEYIKNIVYRNPGFTPSVFKKTFYHMLVYPNKYAYFKTYIIYLPLKKMYLISKKN
ncbi:putative nucleotidyltransferase-like protein [Allofrancisella inopinata]|uniref:Uncharacterized protein n=1 Tax=Allofrancisella inopinata TaxID=1085647 RepID=A0AAE7CQ77_9GAMM|nr:nucleotidyltransferase family protein [Allofrancisella inopinata]QIV95580.1 hypothetical protein E4K63_01495 [Allofrancisella inopinata]TDT70731.1 putative nucleotidyltransferase-like protein [Allofrancisella inopinata]